MLYSERKRLEQLAQREADGENMWTDNVPQPFRQKLVWLVERFGGSVNNYHPTDGTGDIFKYAHLYLTRSRGTEMLVGGRDPAMDFKNFMSRANNNDYPDILESLHKGLHIALDQYASSKDGVLEDFNTEVNKLLERYRINYTLEDGEIAEYSSRELHMQVVIPSLKLLAQSGWESIEKAYRDALNELADGKTDNAITDVTTALQEGLRKVGCTGDTFALLVKSAKNGILKGYDSKYVVGLESLIEWASAIRANKGDSHHVSKPTSDEAWFVVHLVGVLLLHLSNLSPQKGQG